MSVKLDILGLWLLCGLVQAPWLQLFRVLRIHAGFQAPDALDRLARLVRSEYQWWKVSSTMAVQSGTQLGSPSSLPRMLGY